MKKVQNFHPALLKPAFAVCINQPITMSNQQKRNKPAPPPRIDRAVVIVGIVGGSGSGKSWLARKIASAFGQRACAISLDDFYRDRSKLSAARRARINFDHPDAIDWGSFTKVLGSLKSGGGAVLPCYDFSTHCRLESTHAVQNKRLVVIEGLWLYRRPALRRLFDVKVFLECSAQTRLQRRIERDTAERGRSVASVKAQFRNTVQPMHAKYVQPQNKWADVVVSEACTSREIKALTSRISKACHPNG
jgi:uridine kinase